MNNKFITIVNSEFEPFIIMAKVDFHKNIKVPAECIPDGRYCRCGGGWWKLNKNELQLFDDSTDFGKFDFKYTQEAFDKHNVFYFDEPCFDDLNVKTLDMR